ncbi:uncharacterized protein J5F26_004641 [Ciconia maguari]
MTALPAAGGVRLRGAVRIGWRGRAGNKAAAGAVPGRAVWASGAAPARSRGAPGGAVAAGTGRGGAAALPGAPRRSGRGSGRRGIKPGGPEPGAPRPRPRRPRPHGAGPPRSGPSTARPRRGSRARPDSTRGAGGGRGSAGRRGGESRLPGPVVGLSPGPGVGLGLGTGPRGGFWRSRSWAGEVENGLGGSEGKITPGAGAETEPRGSAAPSRAQLGGLGARRQKPSGEGKARHVRGRKPPSESPVCRAGAGRRRARCFGLGRKLGGWVRGLESGTRVLCCGGSETRDRVERLQDVKPGSWGLELGLSPVLSGAGQGLGAGRARARLTAGKVRASRGVRGREGAPWAEAELGPFACRTETPCPGAGARSRAHAGNLGFPKGRPSPASVGFETRLMGAV